MTNEDGIFLFLFIGWITCIVIAIIVAIVKWMQAPPNYEFHWEPSDGIEMMMTHNMIHGTPNTSGVGQYHSEPDNYTQTMNYLNQCPEIPESNHLGTDLLNTGIDVTTGFDIKNGEYHG